MLLESMRTLILLFGIVFFSLIKLDLYGQLVVFTISILLTGVPHGALDFYLDKQQNESNEAPFSNTKFFVNYFLNMGVYAVFWYYFPLFSLLLFIVITALHFGEIDTAIFHKLPKWASFCYGLLIILFIITAHIGQTSEIVAYLLPNFSETGILISIGQNLFLGVLVALFVGLFVAMIWYLKSPNNTLRFFLMQTVLLFTFIYFLPFYLGFAFYFSVWHSLLSFELIINKLQLKKLSNPWKELLKMALPFSVLAWVGLAVGIFVGLQYFNTSELLGRMFVGIAILTLPHLQVFSKAIHS